MRDLEVEFAEQSAAMTPEQRRKAREDMKVRAEALIKQRAQQNMTALQERYDAENPDLGFQAVLDEELQGYSRNEALERLKTGGKLDDARELKYAVFGAGTNEDRIRDVLKGKSKAEIDKLKAEYKNLTGNDLAEDLDGDLSGRDLADTTFLLDGSATPEEKLAYLRRRKEWEVDEGTGILGELFDDEEEGVLERTTAGAGEAYNRYQQALRQYGEKDPRTEAALEEFERWSGYSDKDIEEHRAELDAFTDGLATGAAIVAGLAVSIATAGTATPAAVAGVAAMLGTTTAVVSAAAGAIAATAAAMLTKQLMKGGAYDVEAVAVDMTQGLVESVVAAYTAGMGEAALKALFKNPAFKTLSEAASSGRLGTVIAKGVESGIEGALQGVPSGMASAILSESTWRGDDPFGTIIAAGGKAAAQGAGMGAVMGAGMEAVKGAGKSGGSGEGGTHEGGGAGEGGSGPSVETRAHRPRASRNPDRPRASRNPDRPPPRRGTRTGPQRRGTRTGPQRRGTRTRPERRGTRTDTHGGRSRAGPDRG